MSDRPKIKRRNVLNTTAIALTAGMAGCANNSTENQEEKLDNGPGPDEPIDEDKLAIPFDGLGVFGRRIAYEVPFKRRRSQIEVTIEEIEQIVEESSSPKEEANKLAEVTYINYAYSVFQEYYIAKEDTENSVVFNINWSFTSDSEPILELYTVENGKLQNQPIISDTSHGNITTHHHGDPEPRYLKNLRDPTNWARIVPEDYNAFEDRLEGATEDEKSQAREWFFDKWSDCIFGITNDLVWHAKNDLSLNIKPKNAETSNVVFNAKYGDGDPNTLIQLTKDYKNSDFFHEELTDGFSDYDEEIVMTVVEYTGSGFEFSGRPDHEIGDPLIED